MIREYFLTNNRCYRKNEKIKLRGLMIHSIGCAQDSAELLAKSWNNNGISACVHAFIDSSTGDVWQTLPWTMRGWHAGKTYGNDHYIGVEMCESDYIKYTGGSSFKVLDSAQVFYDAKRTYESAVDLFAELCIQFDLDPLEDGVIISHAEGYARGWASNHGDPEHWWSGSGIGKTMRTFRNDIDKKVKELKMSKLTYDEFKEYMERYKKEEADKEPSNWFADSDARKFVESNKIVQGDEKGAKKYRANCTREEVCQMLFNFRNAIK